ncbi:hypothetical protein EOK75_00770 [Pseudorhodobacter turbinis]|uniref:DUF4760 domain-containing protein n=1 Tax=Pseudorhodobacter turbinis TaxID=2500533 RepID=A0A4P8ECI0_9RHOB|nr:hypothetical protein [Pseudorhodobacter turbinis]QCO54482.1 hypothetical protein EOK75_00770 [Pseudorhodobacter turbinis]
MSAKSAVEDLAGFFSMQWVEVFSALLTPTLACLGLYIAYQQWSVNRANLREKLFERRFSILRETEAFFSEFMRDLNVSEDGIRKFSDTCQRSRFLFGKEIQNYLLEVRDHAVKLKMNFAAHSQMEPGEDRVRLALKRHEEITWLAGQIPKLYDRFEPYLGFEKHR